MKQDLSGKRMDYSKNSIDFSKAPENPLVMFDEWYLTAKESELIMEPYAMNLSTIEADGFPRSRVVLLREYNNDGFIFYTNYNSQKGHAIAEQNKVCLSFFWDKLERQIIIKGIASKAETRISDEYFQKRPFKSRVSALLSAQSSVIDFNRDLEKDLEKLSEEFKEEEVPRPEHWGGYKVVPVEIEFWQGRPSRLHDRLRFVKENGVWKRERLAP